MKRLTPAQRSNFLRLTAWGYAWWRARSLTLLSGQPFGLAREERLFVTLTQPQAGERWLDIGTSTGFYAGVLAHCGCVVDALDISPAMLREAQRREGDGVNWLCLNAENTRLDAERYDGITIGATLNETADPAAMLREAVRLLKPNGRLWLMYVVGSGGPIQHFLSRWGGLTFPVAGWPTRVEQQLRLVHRARLGLVELTLLHKEAYAAPEI